jgi:xylulokinase
MCLKWFAENLALPAEWERAGDDQMAIFGVLDELAAGVESGAGGLLFTPWMFGERSPVTDTTLRAAFVNLSLEHGREHMLRALYEGIAYNIRWMMDEVCRAGLPVRSVRAIGGGARSDTWMQIVADVTGRRVEALANPQEAGALGCALAVAVGLGIYPDYKHIKKVLKVRRSFEPDRRASGAYNRLYEVFRDIYPALSEACHSLNAVSREQL